MKLESILEFVNELKKIENVEATPEFSFAVMKNIALGLYELDEVKKLSLTAIEGGEEYRNDRMAVIEKYAERDEQKNFKSEKSPIDGRGHFVFTGNNKNLFIGEMKIVDEKHSKYIEGVKNKQKELDALLEKTAKIEFVKVPLSCYPNKITPRQMEVLSLMLDEEKEDDK